MTFIFHFDNTVTNVRINILSSLPAPSGYEKPLKGLLYASRESGAAVEGAECGAQLLKAELQGAGAVRGGPVAQPGSSPWAGGLPRTRGYKAWPARREPLA